MNSLNILVKAPSSSISLDSCRHTPCFRPMIRPRACDCIRHNLGCVENTSLLNLSINVTKTDRLYLTLVFFWSNYHTPGCADHFCCYIINVKTFIVFCHLKGAYELGKTHEFRHTPISLLWVLSPCGFDITR